MRTSPNRRAVYKDERYILVLPIRNGNVEGVTLAFCPFSGSMLWSCEYVKNVPHGKYVKYNNGVAQYTMTYNYDKAMEAVATRCAEYVLASTQL